MREADGLVTGYRSYSSVVKPMLQLIGKAPGASIVATTNMMLTKRGPMFLSDTAINIDPTDDLAKIAIMTAKTVKMFGVEPVMAVSFSNFGSSTDPSASKVRGCSLFTQEPPRNGYRWRSSG
jgi:malate dehydrogenase (oxaloacetate-decarboxylating)(NADP+)